MRAALWRLLGLLAAAPCCTAVGVRDLPRLLAAKSLVSAVDEASKAAEADTSTAGEAATRFAIGVDAAEIGADIDGNATVFGAGPVADVSRASSGGAVDASVVSAPSPSSDLTAAASPGDVDTVAVAGWAAREAEATAKLRARLSSVQSEIKALQAAATAAVTDQMEANRSRADAVRLRSELRAAGVQEQLRHEVAAKEAVVGKLRQQEAKNRASVIRLQAETNRSLTDARVASELDQQIVAGSKTLEGLRERWRAEASAAARLRAAAAGPRQALGRLAQAGGSPTEAALDVAIRNAASTALALREQETAIQRRGAETRGSENRRLTALNLHVQTAQARVAELTAARQDDAAVLAGAAQNLTAEAQETAELSKAAAEFRARVARQADPLSLELRQTQGEIWRLQMQVAPLQAAFQRLDQTAPDDVQGLARQLEAASAAEQRLRLAADSASAEDLPVSDGASGNDDVVDDESDSGSAGRNAVETSTRGVSAAAATGKQGRTPKAVQLWSEARQLGQANTELRSRLTAVVQLIRVRRARAAVAAHDAAVRAAAVRETEKRDADAGARETAKVDALDAQLERSSEIERSSETS